MRRRRWQQRLHERKARRREELDQLRAEAKAQVAEQLRAAEEQRRSIAQEADSTGERLQRLQNLRARLANVTASEPVSHLT